ncbi:phage portal protein [Capnocytophaga catalasegens]|uniref:Phage portal protein n=1 Tax=Capnocytophaga catalasegens TaxID=1004260 RepID=A0AAV5AWI5_9FLAO|nr:phage portal protein [Capnocytophaga catalasegens]GIZ15510.1 hypothetical protein RCZ03_15100 [Capnocytophaga catalasegens]GJM49853.1 hypothetical protein RCZ15_08280 [Capnocytophaga catalasegens]GJM54025.1 hypothetical protein RCZ16_23410 [Capnocytophaga catalasegens]
MTIEEILSLSDVDRIKELKSGRLSDSPDIEEIKKQLNPKKHLIFDEKERPDKMVDKGNGDKRKEPVARIALSLQKLIVKRAVSFLFGNPIDVTANTQNDTQMKILVAVKSILNDVKINSHNRKIARELFSCTEVAELWYPMELAPDEVPRYGIDAKNKLRVKILSPMSGDKLYPYFDDYGDMVAFSREYSIAKGDKKSTYFETYTSNLILKYDISDGVPVLMNGFPVANVLGKIPVVYGRQEQTEFAEVQDIIDRLEKLLSNFADTNDYHGSPKIFVKGNIKGFSKKGESGAIIEGDANTEAHYLTWTHAPESVKLEIDTLLRMIYTLTQTPDISFESVKGLGNGASGKALRMLFLDAHLKVADHMEVFDEYLQRRMAILKKYIGIFNTSLAKEAQALTIETEITPFMVDDYTDKLEFVMTATGNKPVLSQKSGIKLAGLVDNADEEFENIQREDSFSAFEPTE